MREPVSSSALNMLDASELAGRLQRREISAEQVVRDCLARIDEREPAVQAWTHLSRDAALAQARELDRGAIRGPLHGLPVGVKDLFDTADAPTTYGSPIYAAHQPRTDAAAVALCRAAGAIVLGKTVSTEFATFHPGTTHNPHRYGHTPGGSSSGSAAAVADYMVPLALGTQTAASVIRPAAFCGVVGYKPSYGSIARAGIKNLAESLDTVGMFARSVADAALLARVLCADARRDPGLGQSQRYTGNSKGTNTDSAPMRIGVCRTFEWDAADEDTRNAMQRGAERLARAGARVVDYVLPPALAPMLQIQVQIMAFEAARNLAAEKLAHPDLLSPALTSLLATGAAISLAQHQTNLAAAAQSRVVVDACFTAVDVLLAPSTIGVAPAGITQSGDPLFGRVWTLLGLPCIHLPFDTGISGLPVGLQLVGRYAEDDKLLAAAAWAHPHLR